MKLVYILLFTIPTIGLAQVGINTNFPLGIFHIDAKKDNVASPNLIQSLDDITISATDGSVMVGGITQTGSKMEINSGTAGVSGLRFRNLTSASPNANTTSSTYLGVDDTGNVVISGKDLSRVATTVENNITFYNNETRNNDGSINTTLLPFSFVKTAVDATPFVPSTFLPGSEVSFTIPSGRPRAVFLNFMMGFALSRTGSNNADGSEAFGAEIVLVNTNTNVVTSTGVLQNAQVPSVLPTRQMFSVNYITNLPAGNYIAKIRINTIRFLFNSAPSNTVKTITFTPTQYSYNITYFES